MNIRNIIKTVLTIAFALGTALAVSAQQDGIPHLRLTDKVFTPAPTKAVVELSANFMREKPDKEPRPVHRLGRQPWTCQDE